MKAILDQNMTFTERFLAKEIAKAIPNGGNIVILKLIERLGFGSRASAVGALRKLAMAGLWPFGRWARRALTSRSWTRRRGKSWLKRRIERKRALPPV